MIRHRALLIASVSLLAAATAFAETVPPPKPQSPPAKPPATNASITLSKDFWTTWKQTKESDGFTTLSKAAGAAESTAAAVEAGKKAKTQAIANVALTKPEETAKFLTGVSAATGKDSETVGALATVVEMRTNEAARAAAAPLVEPETAARVEEWRADLSTGISGLPGIYLVANAEENRPSIPTGYTAVSGGSVGCPSR